jgi:hypothetical protein
MKRLLLVAAAMIVAFDTAGAQDMDEYLKCFGGNPRPCGHYFVFDAIVSRQVGGTMRNAEGENSNGDLIQRNTSIYAGWELGEMWNRGRSTAIGATAEFDFVDGGHGRLAIKGRARRWLSPSHAIDVSLGGVGQTVFHPDWVHVECGTCTETGYGLTADATLGYRLLGVTVGADIIRGYGKTMTSLRVGGRAGGILGVGATVVAAAVMGAAVGGM